MFSPAKRSWLKAAAFAVVAVLAACGKEEPPPPKAAAPAADAKAPAPAEPFKVAWMYVGPVGDAGWTFAHDQARKAVEAEFGAKVKTTFV